MNTSSKKAKARRLQDLVRDRLRSIAATFGLVDDDIKSAIMGTSGVDIVMSPAAQKLFRLDVECKNVERLNVVGAFRKHFTKYEKKDTLKVLVHSRNHQEPLVTLRFEDFMKLYETQCPNEPKDPVISRAAHS